jgi:hypothetical protein
MRGDDDMSVMIWVKRARAYDSTSIPRRSTSHKKDTCPTPPQLTTHPHTHTHTYTLCVILKTNTHTHTHAHTHIHTHNNSPGHTEERDLLPRKELRARQVHRVPLLQELCEEVCKLCEGCVDVCVDGLCVYVCGRLVVCGHM